MSEKRGEGEGKEAAQGCLADDERFTNSYDVFLRGQEICSGAQRVHDPALLISQESQVQEEEEEEEEIDVEGAG